MKTTSNIYFMSHPHLLMCTNIIIHLGTKVYQYQLSKNKTNAKETHIVHSITFIAIIHVCGSMTLIK